MMIRILLVAVALAVLPWLAPRPAHAQGDEQTLVDRATLALQEMVNQSVSEDPRKHAAARPRGDDLPARVQGRLHPGRRRRRLRAAGACRQRHLVLSGVLRHGQRQFRVPDRHPGQPVRHDDHDREGAARDPGQPVQVRRRCLARHRHHRRRRSRVPPRARLAPTSSRSRRRAACMAASRSRAA